MPHLSTKNRFVITGANGFIGGLLKRKLVSQYGAEDILGIDLPDHWEQLAAIERGDIRPEIVFHLGALNDTACRDWPRFERENVEYSKRLWRCATDNKFRLIYASSSTTYGDGSEGFDDEKSLELLNPISYYAKSKHEFDLWTSCQSLAPLQFVGLKFFNVYGPGENNKGRMASMVWHAWNQIKATGRVELFEGDIKRDFVYVDDLIRVFFALMEKPNISGIFNLGTETAHTYEDLVREVFKALGKEPQIDFIPIPEDLRGQYQFYSCAKMHKLRMAGLSFAPTTLAEGVAKYVTWIKEQEA